LDMQTYLQQGTSWAHVAAGTRNQPLKKLGHTSNLTSQPLTVSTSRWKGKPLPTPDSTQLTPPWPKLKIIWMKLPLVLWQTWQQQLKQTEVWWQLLLRPTLVLSNNSRKLLQSWGNLRLYSIRNGVKSGSQEMSTQLQRITSGLMSTRWARLTQASLATLAILATKRRQLGLKTWEVVRPTRNDVSGRQL
jgi:hypothetical protein